MDVLLFREQCPPGLSFAVAASKQHLDQLYVPITRISIDQALTELERSPYAISYIHLDHYVPTEQQIRRMRALVDRNCGSGGMVHLYPDTLKGLPAVQIPGVTVHAEREVRHQRPPAERLWNVVNPEQPLPNWLVDMRQEWNASCWQWLRAQVVGAPITPAGMYVIRTALSSSDQLPLQEHNVHVTATVRNAIMPPELIRLGRHTGVCLNVPSHMVRQAVHHPLNKGWPLVLAWHCRGGRAHGEILIASHAQETAQVLVDRWGFQVHNRETHEAMKQDVGRRYRLCANLDKLGKLLRFSYTDWANSKRSAHEQG